MKFFKMLVKLGFKEIETSFPCSSQTDFDFTRRIVETPGLIPDDVTIQVMTPCRKESMLRTVESVKGAKKVIVLSWISMSDNYRETMLGLTEDEGLAKVIECTKYIRSITVDNPAAQDTEWTYNFGFEDFPNARPEATLRFTEAVIQAWGPSPLIITVASSVESSTPNVFADQVEHFCRNVPDRSKFTLSVHTHNDRGCGVAAAELARLAGGDRLEGCLFGNGERAGNVDLVTLALNLLTQGIDPQLDFSNLPEVRDICQEITQIPVHPRAPYSGEFYFRAFSGSHQDAIIKGFRRQDAGNSSKKSGNIVRKELAKGAWHVPYLPMDPPDIGLGYDCIIKINSQSGKSGVSWLVMRTLGLDLPVGLRIAFSKLMKIASESIQREIQAEEIAHLFRRTYNLEPAKVPLIVDSEGDVAIDGNSILQDLDRVNASNKEAGPAFTDFVMTYLSHILGISILKADLTEQESTSEDTKQNHTIYAECTLYGFDHSFWGVAIGSDLRATQANAILSALYVC
jgi:2-isopropylmalate synthase